MALEILLIFILYYRVSQEQHHWHLGPDNSLLRGCPMHHRMFSNILGLHPLDVSSTCPPVSATMQVSRQCQVLWAEGQSHAQWRATALGKGFPKGSKRNTDSMGCSAKKGSFYSFNEYLLDLHYTWNWGCDWHQHRRVSLCVDYTA